MVGMKLIKKWKINNKNKNNDRKEIFILFKKLICFR